MSVADPRPDSFDWLSPAHARRVLILGAGRSGHAAQTLAVRLGFDPVLLDGDVPLPDGAFAFAVVSPGIAPAHPWRTACAARGLRVMSELAFGVAACRRRGVRLLAVTGSKGKSSVVKAVADALAAAGRAALPCGNYGLPVSAVACRDAVAWAVVEVSSFQMETTFLPPDTFEAAVVLNLQEDHLDRHASVAVYHALKLRLLTMAKETVVADADAFPAGARGGYFDNSVLRANGAAAAGLLQAAGLTAAAAAAALRAFTPLAHRMHPVGVFGGVRCIDDSKATSLAALAAGVDMAGTGVRLVAGGISKGDDPRSVIPLLTERVKKVYLIGQCAESFYAAWAGVVPCEICGTMARAVASAWREAARGDTLLLSPGTASFDQFDSFEHRGDVFAELVKKEGQKRK